MKAVRLLIPFAGALLLSGLFRWAAPEHGLSGRYFLNEARTGEPVQPDRKKARLLFPLL